MFKRKQTQFEITEHPDVTAALNAMWEAAYEAGRRDALAIAKDELAEMASRPWEGEGKQATYLEGMERVVDALES
jgi:hypothetical protein